METGFLWSVPAPVANIPFVSVCKLCSGVANFHTPPGVQAMQIMEVSFILNLNRAMPASLTLKFALKRAMLGHETALATITTLRAQELSLLEDSMAQRGRLLLLSGAMELFDSDQRIESRLLEVSYRLTLHLLAEFPPKINAAMEELKSYAEEITELKLKIRELSGRRATL